MFCLAGSLMGSLDPRQTFAKEIAQDVDLTSDRSIKTYGKPDTNRFLIVDDEIRQPQINKNAITQ
jgi:hypothetical protein